MPHSVLLPLRLPLLALLLGLAARAAQAPPARPEALVATPVGLAEEQLEAPSLIAHPQAFARARPYGAEDTTNALRYLLVPVRGGETVTFRLWSEDAKVTLAVSDPPKGSPLTGAIRRANLSPGRTQGLRFSNPTGGSIELPLLLFGESGHAYRLEIRRQAQ